MPFGNPYAAVAALFLISRLVYRIGFGVRFDPAPVSFYIQYMDPWFFKNHFWQSLLYLHHQAPLQNVLVAIPLRFLEASTAFVVLDVVYVTLALVTLLGIVHVLLRLGVRPFGAILGTSVFVVSPVTVLYENWLFYHTPVTFCLLLSVIALDRYYRLGTFRAGLLFFSLLAVTSLIRSLYTTLFIGAVAVLLLVCPPLAGDGRRSARAIVVRAAALPILIVALNAWKPKLLIGYDYGEPLLWGNLVTKIYRQLPPAEKQRLLDERLISRTALLFPLADLHHFRGFRIPHPPTGVPLLDLERAPNGRWNTHAIEYLLITRKYYKPDAIYLLSNYPLEYLRSAWRSLSTWYLASPSTDEMLPITPNYVRLRGLDSWIKWALGHGEGGRLTALAVALPLTFCYGVYRILRKRARLPSERRSTAMVAFMLLTIGYVTSTTNLVSPGDFSRYRFDIDPFYLIVFTLLLAELWRAGAERVRRRWPFELNRPRP